MHGGGTPRTVATCVPRWRGQGHGGRRTASPNALWLCPAFGKPCAAACLPPPPALELCFVVVRCFFFFFYLQVNFGCCWARGRVFPPSAPPPPGPGLRRCKQPSHDGGCPGAARAVPGGWPSPPHRLRPMDFNKEINPPGWALWRWDAAVPGGAGGGSRFGDTRGCRGGAPRGLGGSGGAQAAWLTWTHTRAFRPTGVTAHAPTRPPTGVHGPGPGRTPLGGVAERQRGRGPPRPSRRFKFEARAFPPEFVSPPR